MRHVSYDQFANAPATIQGLAYAEVAALLKKGWADCSIINWDDRLFIAETDDGAVGAVIVWRKTDIGPAAFIALGCTDPAFRRQGIYAATFKAFVEMLKEREPTLVRVESAFHKDNVASAVMHEALGRQTIHLTTRFNL